MRIVVQKYGGSSVADEDKIKAVAKRIKATKELGYQVLVVVSAMGESTDELVKRASRISDNPSRRELDMLLSCGERISMALLAMAVQELGIDAVSLTGSQSGIITNDQHSGARIIEVRPFRIQDALNQGKVVIVAGFQGTSYRAEVTTLGRGGSDTTAVALAGALGAEYCEICSDVAGVYTGDPREITAAQLIEAISHEAMLELTSHGAKVLHPESVAFAERLGIALYARATNDAPLRRGTRIDKGSLAFKKAPISVASLKELWRIQVKGFAHFQALAEVLKGFQMALIESQSEDHKLSLWCQPLFPTKESDVQKALPQGSLIETGYAAVSLVHDDLGQHLPSLQSVLALLEKEGFAFESLSSNALRITVFLKADLAKPLGAALHRYFIETH